VPNKAGLGLLGLAAWAAPLEVGVTVGTLAAFADRGSVALELRARDAMTGDVIAMAADRETGAMRVIDLRSVTWYGNARSSGRGTGDGRPRGHAEYRAGRALALLHAHAVVTPSAAGFETTPAHDAEPGDCALTLVRRVQHREIEQAAEAYV